MDGWDAIAFYSKKPPSPRTAAQVRASRAALASAKVWVRIAATDALPGDAHPLVQLGAACAAGTSN